MEGGRVDVGRGIIERELSEIDWEIIEKINDINKDI